MISPELNYWIYAELSLKSKADGSAKTIKVSNRPVLGDTDKSFWPILKSVSRLGSDHDRLGPTSFSGSIQIYDHIGSFGAERKLSDVLQRYVIQDQSISVYVSASDLATTDPVWTLAFKGDVVSWQRSVAGTEPLISILIQSRLFDRRVITKELTLGNFSTAPVRTIGKFLPVVFGEDIEVNAYQITADGLSACTYAYATTFGTTFKNGGVQAYYIKDDQNKYKQVNSAASTTTKLFDATTGTTVSAVTGNDEDSRTRDLGVVDGVRYVITQADVIYTQGGAGQTGSLILEIWEKDQTGLPNRRIAQSIRDKSDYTWGAGKVTVEHIFDKPVALTSSNGYMAYVSQTTRSGTEGHPSYTSGGTAKASYTLDETSVVLVNNGWTRHVFDQVDFASTFYGIVFTDTPTPSSGDIDNNGLGHSYFEITQKAQVGSIPNPNITALDFIVSIDGLKDDSSGTVTGVANQQIKHANYALELVSREWSGSAWDASAKWDWTDPYSSYALLNSGFLNRYFQGATTGRVTLEDFARNACDNSAGKIVLRNDGKLCYYAWGTYQGVGTLVTQDESELINHEILDPSYVINNVKFGYARNLKDFNSLNQASQGIPNDYQQTIDWYSGVNSTYDALAGVSETLFGKRFLQRSAFDFINDQASAEVLAVAFLSQFNHPAEIVTIEAPFFESADLEPLEIINFNSPSMPAYYGSSPNALVPDFNGFPTDPSGGYGWVRAEPYRLQIQSRFIDFTGANYPRLMLSCRVLNQEGDPT